MQLYPGWSARDNYVSGQTHAVGEPSACHTLEEVRTAVLKAHRRRGQGGAEAQDFRWLAQERLR